MIPTLEKKYVKSKIATLNDSLRGESPSTADIIQHIAAVENDPEFQLDPEFPPSLDWFNTISPLSFSNQLQGKIVVLDFFTYCCVNCMHILGDLATLESRHPVEEGVAVIGVHSAKFGNEKVSDNIRNAIDRCVIWILGRMDTGSHGYWILGHMDTGSHGYWVAWILGRMDTGSWVLGHMDTGSWVLGHGYIL